MPALTALPTDLNLLALKLIATIIAVIVLSVICLFLLIRIRRKLKIENKREHTIKLDNQGNFTSIFLLSVASGESMFRFDLLSNGIPLPRIAQNTVSEEAETPVEIVQPATSREQKKSSGTGMGAVVKSGRAVAARAGQAASFLSTLGSLLPGSMGAGLRQQSESLRQTQANAQMVAQVPNHAQRKVESLQQQSGRLATGKPVASTSSGSGNGRAASQAVPQSGPDKRNTSNLPLKEKSSSEIYTVQTKPMEPGSTLSLLLRIQAAASTRPNGTYTYTISSQQIPVEALRGEQAPAVTRQGILHFQQVEIWRYWLAPAASVLVISIMIFFLLFVVRFIWY